MDGTQRNKDIRKKKKMMEIKKKISNLTKEQLKAAVEKKKICNSKAMTIVERLIEPNVEESWLLENLFYINQSHYQDAVEERAIIKCCGYPLCNGSLEAVPKKQYHISTKLNKVYDITDRKNYCSNVCYKAGVHIKEQLYTSPLWLRDCEDVFQYKLLSTDYKKGSTGIEVDLGNVSPVKSDEVDERKLGTNLKNENVSDINFYCGATVSRNDLISCKEDTQSVFSSPDSNVINEFTVNIHKNDKSTETASLKLETKECIQELCKVNEKQKDKVDRAKVSQRTTPKKQEHTLNVKSRVDACMDSWFTVYSLRFLYGDDKVKEMFEDFGTPLERFGQLINTKDAFLYERYSEICRRLNFIEMKEKLEEREELLSSEPLPDYEYLKKETEELTIKVKSFYLGDNRVSFQDISENNGNKEENKEDKNVLTPILPILDQHSVMAARRRIVLDKLRKTLPDIQSALGLGQFNIRHEIQEFIHTLALTATNITLSPSEWNLMSIVIIKLFTLRNELLDSAFHSTLTQKRIINLLLFYGLDLDFLEICIIKLTNMEQIIKNSPLSVE